MASSLPPLAGSSRRESVASIASPANQDPSSPHQALSQIHTAASQTDSLTTFNEFATASSASASGLGKGSLVETQGGLAGLYNRIKASVGAPKSASNDSSLLHEDSLGDSSTASTSKASQIPFAALHSDEAADTKQTASLTTALTNQEAVIRSQNESHQPTSSAAKGPDGGKTKASDPAPLRDLPKPSSTAGSSQIIVPLFGIGKAAIAPPVHIDPKDAVRAAREPKAAAAKVSSVHSRSHSERTETGSSLDTMIQDLVPQETRGSNRPEKGKPSEDVSHSSPSYPAQQKVASAQLQEMAAASRSKQESKPRGDREIGPFEVEDDATARRDSRSAAPKDVEMPQAPLGHFSDRQSVDAPKLSILRRSSPSRQPNINQKAEQLLPGFRLSRASSIDTARGSSAIGSAPGGSDDGNHPKLTRAMASAPQVIVQRASLGGQASQVRSRILSKEYWMRDENARDCFYCGETFSTFRRKHHCRTCGQIFDAKCTSLVSGAPFGQSGSLRVCKPCEDIIQGHDDSSDFSDDASIVGSGLRPRHGSSGGHDISPARSMLANRLESVKDNESLRPADRASVPSMAIAATRRAGDDANRRSSILEIEADPKPPRPTSSRSFKAFAGRPHDLGHKRHHSRNLLQRSLKTGEERAPFHRGPDEAPPLSNRLPAFHSDSVIDPELAEYLSDEDSTGDEQVGIMAALYGNRASKTAEHDGNHLGILGASKKGRSRGDKSTSGLTFASRDADNASLSSARFGNARNSRRRNLSLSGNMHFRSSPRPHHFSAHSPSHVSQFFENMSHSPPDQSSLGTRSKMIRSSSMKGAAAPAVELNQASIQHVHKLLNQLLRDASVPNVGAWEKALLPILLQATDDVNPDVQNGDDIDVRHYVKLKRIPGGKPGDTSYVSGLVFTKNLALKSMPRSIAHPRILILTFPLEYVRHQQHFMSLEPVIRQEREFLQNLVHRIAALRPQLLLVQRGVSGLALEYLEQAKIATACNVKPSVLEAISRCSQTRIISSIDKLAVKPATTGQCASFYLKTFVHSGRRKTCMFLAGCPKELGCTIVLRGGEQHVLARLKRITEFMIYVVYNLKLETCLMRDEFALIPAYAGSGSISPVMDATNRAKAIHQENSAVESGIGPVDDSSQKLSDSQSSGNLASRGAAKDDRGAASHDASVKSDIHDEAGIPDDIPMPTLYSDMVEKYKTKILSGSPFVKFMQPYLLVRAREQERRILFLKRLRDQSRLIDDHISEAEAKDFILIEPEMIHETVQNASSQVREVLHAIHDAEYDKALHVYRTQKKQWEAYTAANINLFDPMVHQSIAILYSVVCTTTSVPCSGPDLLALGFYNEHEVDADFEADCTLGQYVEDLCLGASTVCIANGCERKMYEHHRQYVHGDAQISVTVELQPSKVRGLQDIILMWSTCRVCGSETQVLPMSESSWKYSFGKYLELSFWSQDLHARAGLCPHDLHRDHVRCFGFKDVTLRVQFDPITLLEIVVPRTRITWKVVNDLKFKNDVYRKTEEKLHRFMSSVQARIKGINIGSVIPEKADVCKEEIDRLTKLADEDSKGLILKLQQKYTTSKYFEVIPMNRAVRYMQEKVAEWDTAFADFDQNYFPSEKDIRRLAALQLRKMFLDRDDSVSSLTSTEEGTSMTADSQTTGQSSPDDGSLLESKSDDTRSSVTRETPETTSDQSQLQDSAPLRRTTIATSIPTEEALTPRPKAPGAAEPLQQFLDVPPRFPPQGPGMPDIRRPPLDGRSLSLMAPSDDQRSRETVSSEPEPISNAEDVSTADNTPRPSFRETFSTAPAPFVSSIPKPTDANHRASSTSKMPSFQRAQSQKALLRKDRSKDAGNSTTLEGPSSSALSSRSGESDGTDPAAKHSDKRLVERLGLGALKAGMSNHSLIPRSIGSRRKESKVSTLAKHFEQLSREFERERMRDRKQRAAKSRQARAYPMAASKPIVEVYRNALEAVGERDAGDDELTTGTSSMDQSTNTSEGFSETATADTKPTSTEDGDTAHHTSAELTETDENTADGSPATSDNEAEGPKLDEEHGTVESISDVPDSQTSLSLTDSNLDLELPKHEKRSLMKMLTNFWAERSASGWQPLEYPLAASDHIFADSDIIILEDEPSSLIAFALSSLDYTAKLKNIQARSGNVQVSHDGPVPEDSFLSAADDMCIEKSLLQSTGTHLKYQFQEGSAKMLCKIFYAEQFDAVRKKCGVADRIVESLSRCLKWDSKGGKTKSVFLKTLDDRLVLKSLSPIETQAFLRFAPAYFQLMGEVLFHDLPSVIAKMLGFYQIVIKNPVTGVEYNWFLLLMENLFYDRSPNRIFDLKGSMRNRRIQSTGEQNEVLLDENMVEFIYESPLFTREHSKKLLRASVWNDTLFLSRQNVMDYSLMIAIDEKRKELVVGMIDCIRTYTWDKKLESWMKDRGKNRPTVTSPKEYKSRFREAMGRYVLQAPNCWHQLKTQHARYDITKQGDEEKQEED